MTCDSKINVFTNVYGRQVHTHASSNCYHVHILDMFFLSYLKIGLYFRICWSTFALIKYKFTLFSSLWCSIVKLDQK